MSRPLEFNIPAPSIIFESGRARQPTFVDDAEYRAFLETVTEAHRLAASSVCPEKYTPEFSSFTCLKLRRCNLSNREVPFLSSVLIIQIDDVSPQIAAEDIF
jgi:hypothetical protein